MYAYPLTESNPSHNHNMILLKTQCTNKHSTKYSHMCGATEMREWKMRYGQKCKGGKCGNGKIGSKSQG